MKTYAFPKLFSRLGIALLLASGIFSSGATGRETSAAPAATDISAFQQVTPGAGWILFGGDLYWTNNNGAAWTDITPDASTKIEAVTFLDAARGRALLSDSSGYALAGTEDGGATWQVTSLKFPELAQVDSAVAKAYLGWRTDAHGWLVFKLATGSNFSRGLLFVTFDGGGTWEARPIPLGEAASFINEANGWVAGGATGNEFYETRDGGRAWQAISGGVANRNDDPVQVKKEAGMTEVSASTAESAWAKWESGQCADSVCAREVKLMATRDGGAIWSDIALPNGQNSLRENISIAKSPAFADSDTQPYAGQGFDKCEIATLAQMQNWWNNSPYSAVNLYIGGISRACGNAALNATFVSQMNAQGWRFIPTWVGLQAACTGYAHRMSYDIETARQQGKDEADAASAVAQALGLTNADGSGAVIYFDLEAYNTSDASCRAAANAFVDGWTSQMQLKGNLSGVYGASCGSAPTDWWSLPNVPDALWVANWYDNAGEVSYTRTATVWNTACLSNTLWANRQRLRQYAGTHTETWGGLSLSIDSNVLDGPLTVPNGSANLTAPSAPISPGPAEGATLDRTSDTWLSWKTNGDACSVHVWSAVYDQTVASNCSLYHLGVLYGGAYSWQVTAANGFGSTVGPTWHFNVRPAAPTGLVANPVSGSRVNLGWTLSSDEPAIDGYNVYADGALAGSVAGGVNNFAVQNLTCNTPHSFYVKATRQGIESNASNTANATTASCVPNLVSPIGGVTTLNLRPPFTWQAVATATSYNINVSTTAAFSSLVINASSTTTTYTPTFDLLPNTTYYWRVRAIGPFGIGDWSVTGNFVTPSPPSIPALVSPASNGLVHDYTPSLDWKDVTVPASTTFDHYRVQVANDFAFTSLLYDEEVAVSEFTIPLPLAPNGKYYWHVAAYNTLGQYSSWSLTRAFRTAILPPDLLSPSDGEFLLTRRPSFDWTDVTGATSYSLQLSKVANFSSIYKTISSAVSSLTLTRDLPANTLFYWRVRANGTNGPSLWSPGRSFTTGNPPSVPALLSPRNRSLVSDLTPRFLWKSVTLPAGTNFGYYQVQVATDSLFGNIVINGTITAHATPEFTPVTPLSAGTKYFWRVMACNDLGHCSAWSQVWSFKMTAGAALAEFFGL